MRAIVYRFGTPSGQGQRPQNQSFVRGCLTILLGLVAMVFALGLAFFLFMAGLAVLLFLSLRRSFLRLFPGNRVGGHPKASRPANESAATPRTKATAVPPDPATDTGVGELEQFHGNLEEWFASKARAERDD